MATRSLLESPECSIAQQRLIEYATNFVEESTRLLDSLAIVNENNNESEADDKSTSGLKINIDLADKLKTRKRRIMEQKERAKERKESIERHHEKADFFFNLDKLIAHPANALAAIMSDLVQDLELAKKMCNPSQMDELFNALRQVNEKLFIFHETGKFGEKTGPVNDNEAMQSILDLHYHLRFLTVVAGNWMSAIVANDVDAYEVPSTEMKTLVLAIYENIRILYRAIENKEMIVNYHSVIKELVNIFHISSGQKDDTRKVKLDEKHRIIAANLMKVFQSIPGTAVIDEAVGRILNASAYTIGKKVNAGGSKKINDDGLKNLTSANIAIGEMYEKMSVDIIGMAECGRDFSTSVESFVIDMSQVESARPKMKQLCVAASEVVVSLRKIASHNLCQKYEDKITRAVKVYQGPCLK